ncbi:MAG: hypothetical protein KGL39_32960 [Patescibacteria group bacterium]|nr:hypothetical protein [Patescibacteria group bacterium]
MSTVFFEGNQNPILPVNYKPVFDTLQPRAMVIIDGHGYPLDSFRCSYNAHGATDEATVVLPISGDASPELPAYPDWTTSIARSDELGNGNVPVFIKIYAGFGTPNTLRFSGTVDMYSVQFDGNKTTFTARSLAGPLTSTKITTPFANQETMTTQAFIQKACATFGLSTKFTPNPSGYGTMLDVLGSEYVTGVRSWYIWDLMLQCAQYDDVDIWVDRSGVLHYEAASLIKRANLEYVWGSNILRLTGTHSPQFSRNVSVQVHSWTKQTRITSVARIQTDVDGGVTVTQYTRAVTSTPIFGTTEVVRTSISGDGTVTVGTTTSSGGSANAGTGFASAASDTGKQRYIFFVKNKTLAQCVQIANNIWRQISQHEFAIKLSAPVTKSSLAVMDVTASIVLYETPMSGFNVGYWPRQIVESFDTSSGWMWDIDAVNHELAQGAV